MVLPLFMNEKANEYWGKFQSNERIMGRLFLNTDQRQLLAYAFQKSDLAKITLVTFARYIETNYRLMSSLRKILDLVGIHVVSESLIPTHQRCADRQRTLGRTSTDQAFQANGHRAPRRHNPTTA